LQKALTEHRGKVSIVPLSVCQEGQTVKVVAIKEGRALQARLAAMGVFPGTEIEILKDPTSHPSLGHGEPGECHGPFIVRRGDCRLILGWGMAQKLLVAT